MTLQITDIKDFPSKQAEVIQKHLLELDNQGKLLDYFKEQYLNLGKYNSLARYIKDNWETDGKKLYLEWTGIETFSDKHTIKRTGVKLSEISYGSSNRYFLWKCSKCQYEWIVAISTRTYMNSGCPECWHRKQAEAAHSKGEPLDKWCNANGKYGQQLKSEFVGKLEDGTPIILGDISKGSNNKVYWKCYNPDCDYEWTARVTDRTCERRRGCPACGGHTLIPGKNDLETYCHKHPELNYILEEFVGIDENKQPIKPSEVARASTKKVWFECNKCHKRWLAATCCRTGRDKTGCPHCCNIGTSFPEQYIYYSLKQIFPDTLSRAKDPINNYEYDITIPSLRLCIEYSGYSWHKDKLEHDIEKEEHCKSNNINFLQIYEHTGNIKDTDGNTAQDSYTPSQILYKVERDKALHITQLQYIIRFILQEYSPEHSIEEIDFELAKNEANKVMNKA